MTINAIPGVAAGGQREAGFAVQHSRSSRTSRRGIDRAKFNLLSAGLTGQGGSEEPKMKIDVLTLFPAMFAEPRWTKASSNAREDERRAEVVQVHNLRDYTHDRHKTVDDRPFGGGPGMLLKPEPVFEAVENLAGEKTKVILLSPTGRKFDQAIARELAQQEELLLICGSYEGFDERIREQLADDELSIGDYVLTNGALPPDGSD